MKREAFLYSRTCDIYGNATRTETFEKINTYLNYSNTDKYGFETMMQLQILGFLLLFIPIGLYFQNNLTIKITRDEKVKTYKLISVAFLYLILLIILSVVSIVLTQSTAVKTLNNQLSSINFIKGVVESRCFDQYALGGYYPKPVDKDRLPGAPVTEVVDVNKKYLIDQLIEQDTATKSRLQYMIVTQICIIVIIVLSMIYLAVSLNALHLIKNFKMIN